MSTAQYQVIRGNNIDILKTYPDNHFDSIVTDPPYGIAFLGKDWDNDTGAIETWQECYRVLKPGGYILAFSAARTYHHLATNIESVGFEIRDQIMWLYGSGFPKAQDMGKAIAKRNGMKLEKVTFSIEEMTKVEDFIYRHNKTNKMYRRLPNINGGKAHAGAGNENNLYEAVYKADNEWAGWKTQLKPAHEPIVMARKPFKGSCVDNVLEHGTGALNIDASRIPYVDEVDTVSELGRYPSNVIGEIALGYQKYFYCPKVNKKERHIGYEQNTATKSSDGSDSGAGTRTQWEYCGDCEKTFNGTNDHSNCDPDNKKIRYQTKVGNNHPTVKPVALMKYLIQLVTPPGGIVLDPFNGSGSTGMAAVELGHEYIGCELDPNYVAISSARIRSWYQETLPESNFDNLFE